MSGHKEGHLSQRGMSEKDAHIVASHVHRGWNDALSWGASGSFGGALYGCWLTMEIGCFEGVDAGSTAVDGAEVRVVEHRSQIGGGVRRAPYRGAG